MLDIALETHLANPGDADAGGVLRLALYLMDLDGFKAVNDRWGHEAGDLLRREVAQRLQQMGRSAAELLSVADAAMYGGKQGGRHTLVAAA